MLRTLQIGKPSEPWAKQIINHWLTPLNHAPWWLAAFSLGQRLLLLPDCWSQIFFTIPGRIFGYQVVWLTDSRKFSPALGRIIKNTARWSHSILAPNQAQEVSYLRLGIPSAKIHLLYPPVVTKNSPSYLEPKTLILACDASIEVEEGLGTLLRAASLARDILGNLKLILGGSLSGKAYLDWSAKELNLSGCIQLSPGESDLWLESVQVYILPTTADKAVPPSLAQAMAAGKALIASDRLNHREFVEPEKNGLLVPENNAEALSQAIIRLARNGELLSKLSQGSYKFAQERFTLQVFQNKLKSLILG